MPKIFIVFLVSIILSFIFQFVMGGNAPLNFEQITIRLNVTDILIVALLITNLAFLIAFLKRK